MRKKEPKETFGIADDIEFDIEHWPPAEENTSQPETVPTAQKQVMKLKDADIDPGRDYTPYYKPRPKTGPCGGKIGRGAVPIEKRIIQFTMSCTKEQKQRFMEAAEKENRRLPNFICNAVEDYIKRNGLGSN